MALQPNLDPTLPTPLYRQLSTYIQSLIDTGELSPGHRLPPTRELAGQLGLNRTTVSAAYDLLEAEGRISGQVGRGSFVAARAPASAPDWASLIRPYDSAASPTAEISFAASRPASDLFPLAAFRQTVEEVLSAGELPSLLQLGPAGGYEPLRRFLLDEARSEGALGRDDDLLITSGCQQALDLIQRVLIAEGSRVAVEDPVYPGLKNIFAGKDVELTGVTDSAQLAQGRPHIAFVTPNFQNPTGRTLSLEARESILRGSRAAGTVVVENDIYSSLRYAGDAVPSLKQLAPDAGTLLLRSFSKVAFPGLRVGWVIGPRPAIAALRHAKQLTDLHSDQFAAAIMLRFAESGRLAAHLANVIGSGRERLAIALEALASYFPAGSTWTRPEGGFNLWVTLPRELDSAALLHRAQTEGVTYLPGSTFAVSHPANSSFRLSFGGSTPGQIQTGIATLGGIFRKEHEHRRWAETQPAAALV